ncbi:hypothetical protein [Sphingomonas sp. CLY1604]
MDAAWIRRRLDAAPVRATGFMPGLGTAPADPFPAWGERMVETAA